MAIDYAVMHDLVYKGKAADVKALVEQALAEKCPANEILQDGLIKAMDRVGLDFRENRLYLPEVLVAARAMKTGVELLRPHLSASESVSNAGTVVVGTVKGDLHDIGKNLVGMMSEGAGMKVIDLGVDQSAENFVKAAKENKADIVGLSALLTTTMTYMKSIIEAFKKEGLGHVKICVGGAPLDKSFTEEIGADGYAPDAASAVDLFKSLISKG